MKTFLLTVIFVALPAVILADIFELDLTPQKAQKYINEAKKMNIDYAQKIAENALPEMHNENGEFVYNNNVIENPDDYVEVQYNVKQFHGQDGLGQYTYGYNDGNQIKHESRNENDTVSGFYKYLLANGTEHVRKYTANATGFYDSGVVTKTPEVLAAEKAHEEAWIQQALLTGANPDRKAPEYQEKEGYYDPSGDEKYKYVPQYNKYQSGPEETGEPKGFYYEHSHNATALKKIAPTI